VVPRSAAANRGRREQRPQRLPLGVRQDMAFHPAECRRFCRQALGTCDALGPVAFRLTGVGAETTADGDPVPEIQIAGAPSALEVDLSVSSIDAVLADIIGGEHAIAVYASDEELQTPIACGDIGGPMLGEDLIVGVGAQGPSGRPGVAVLHPEGDATRVTLYLTQTSTHKAATPTTT
ncbi:MAG: hypothetical protein M3Q03_09705, partial [Chloroflexota bacterium]|nr:hypothetical protein [Chloroflexota bacterium]